MSWHVVYTKPRAEYRAQAHLLVQGFEVYLPLIEAERISRGKLIKTPEPLFARYLFVKTTQMMADLSVIRSTKGVSHLLRFGVGAEPAKVPDELIERISQLIEMGETLITDCATSVNIALATKPLFKAGQDIKVSGGVFEGFTGIFQKIKSCINGEARALILLELLGKPHLLNMPLGDLKAA